MMARFPLWACFWACLWAAAAPAAKLPDWYGRTLADAEFEARLVRELAEIERVAGDSFQGEIVLVELRVRPLYGSRLALRRADFLLRARNNNDTSPAQSPDRIAGSAVLALGAERSSSSGGVFADETNSPIWGGAPGSGTRPRRLGAPPRGVGAGAGGTSRQTLERETRSADPVLGRLQAIELPLVAADKPISGYLYFELPAKTKRKHLELSYDGELGEFLIEFKKPE